MRSIRHGQGVSRRSRLAIALLILTATSALMGISLFAYSKLHTIPSGVTISGWKVQGMRYELFLEQFNRHIHRLQNSQVVLRSERPRIEPASFTLHQLGFESNSGQIRKEIAALHTGSMVERIKRRWQMRNEAFQVAVYFDEGVLTESVNRKWRKLQSIQPVNASRTITADDRVVYTPEIKVHRIQISRLKADLEQLFPTPRWTLDTPQAPMDIELAVQELSPRITLKSLQEEGIERMIVQFSTAFRTRGEGRIHNIRSTAQVIHDRLLEPGEIFDYSKVIQETKQKFGFKEAPVIFNGKIVPGIGGGICQVSSTLYNAVLRSGLEIVERRNHSLPISYVPLGQDATFSSGNINFKFRNNSGKHLLIRTASTKHGITVKLFGTLPKEISYTIKSNIVKIVQPPVKYVRNPSLKVGQQEIIRRGKTGYIVETYRYKKLNGTIIKEELISKDTYKAQPILISINKGNNGADRNSEPQHKQDNDHQESPQPGQESIIEDGVGGPVFD